MRETKKLTFQNLERREVFSVAPGAEGLSGVVEAPEAQTVVAMQEALWLRDGAENALRQLSDEIDALENAHAFTAIGNIRFQGGANRPESAIDNYYDVERNFVGPQATLAAIDQEMEELGSGGVHLQMTSNERGPAFSSEDLYPANVDAVLSSNFENVLITS